MDENPMKDIRDICPTSLSHIVGQRSVVDQLTVALDASFADGRKMDDCLLVGPPGSGKSQFASIVAQEHAADFHEVIGQSIKTPADLNALLLAAKPKSVVHVDECHEMDRRFQTALYLALDKRTIFLSGGKNIQSIPNADFTLLLSTTDEYCPLQPLRNRMKLVLRFQFYSNEELTKLLLYRIRGLEWDVHEEILPLIAKRSRGTPRLALRLLQSCRRVCRAEGEMTIRLRPSASCLNIGKYRQPRPWTNRTAIPAHSC